MFHIIVAYFNVDGMQDVHHVDGLASRRIFVFGGDGKKREGVQKNASELTPL